MDNNKLKAVLLLLVFLLGGISGVYLSVFLSKGDVTKTFSDLIEERDTGYEYISPLLDCNYDNYILEGDLLRTKEETENLVEKLLKSNSAEAIAVYFRSLNNGPWFEINGEENFTPASLLKVPVMMAVYKHAESNPKYLDKEIELIKNVPASSQDDNPDIVPLNVGEKYSVDYLVEKMIIDSDNDAINLLANDVPSIEIKNVHQKLGITYPDQRTPEDFISVKSYSSIFRVLYNASYLNNYYSEKALDNLFRSKFKGALAAGVDSTIKVSNKFGIRDLHKDRTLWQLHDCGIIYYPKNPYLLCVMTKGEDEQELMNVIKEISKEIYVNVKSF